MSAASLPFMAIYYPAIKSPFANCLQTTMKSLAFIVLSLLVTITSAYKVRLQLTGYPHFEDKEIVSGWMDDITPDFHIKYHVTHRGPEDKISFRLEVRAPSPSKPLENFATTGYFSILNLKQEGKERRKDFQFSISPNNTISEWFDVMPRKEILDEKNGWMSDLYTVHVENGISYDKNEIGTEEGEKLIELHA